MRKLAFILLLAACSCDRPRKVVETQIVTRDYGEENDTVRIYEPAESWTRVKKGNCEYWEFYYEAGENHRYAMTHCGDCPNPLHIKQ